MPYRFSDQNDPADFESELIFNFLINECNEWSDNRLKNWISTSILKSIERRKNTESEIESYVPFIKSQIVNYNLVE